MMTSIFNESKRAYTPTSISPFLMIGVSTRTVVKFTRDI